MGSEYLWGRDLLIAPVFVKGAATRDVYLPAGDWYDWWTLDRHTGGKTVRRKVDLSTMPIYVRAGAIIPVDPIRQYTSQPLTTPTTLQIYPGCDGDFTLYQDDGVSQDYLHGKSTLIHLSWNDSARTLTLRPEISTIPTQATRGAALPIQQTFLVKLMTEPEEKKIAYKGKEISIRL
jgi:alpha-glucosidase/alpha-D-xyloside xylohydrolase